MMRTDIETQLIEIAKRILKVDVGPESDSTNTLNWDSLRHVEIIFAAEETLEVEFPEDSLTAMKSIRALTDAAHSYLTSQQP